jgi:hypothetical protein
LLESTFIHIPGVRERDEQRLWRAGITTWGEFLTAKSPLRGIGIDPNAACSFIGQSLAALHDGDAGFFARSLPTRESWRMYPHFRDRTAFLDIETTGLSSSSNQITMVGILDTEGYHPFVNGENLDELREALEAYDMVVTYNGASFDLPFIEHHFGQIFRGMAHLDLMYPLRRLGLRGGLKYIEKALGFERPSDLSDLNGFAAVLMWQLWQDGSREACDTLVRYNAEDVLSLPLLADFVYKELCGETPLKSTPILPFPRHEIDLPYSLEVVKRVSRSRGA